MFTLCLNSPYAFSCELDFPSTWNELSTAEMEMVCMEQLEERESGHVKQALILTQIVELRAKAEGITLPRDWKSRLNFEDAATQGFDAIQFLFKEKGNDRTINPYKRLVVAGKTLMGPADDFNSITCGEMEDCETILYYISKEPSVKNLASLAAILWRPRFAPYKAEASEKRAPGFEKLPVEKLLCILAWYTGCNNVLPKYFPDVYSSSKADTTDEGYDPAFTKCIHAGAGPKNGTRDEIRKMLAKEFLFDMQLEAEAAERLKREYERQ